MLGLGAALSLLGFAVGIPLGNFGLFFVGTLGAIFLLIGIIALFVQLAR